MGDSLCIYNQLVCLLSNLKCFSWTNWVTRYTSKVFNNSSGKISQHLKSRSLRRQAWRVVWWLLSEASRKISYENYRRQLARWVALIVTDNVQDEFWLLTVYKVSGGYCSRGSVQWVAITAENNVLDEYRIPQQTWVRWMVVTAKDIMWDE